MKTLKITNEMLQQWIDAEKDMANFSGSDHPAYDCHSLIGGMIYGKNIDDARDYIFKNSKKEISINNLKHFEI